MINSKIRSIKTLISRMVLIIYRNCLAGASFLAPSSDKANGRRTLREVYGLRSGGYNGRSTVPMLWSMDKGDVVCNESYGIIEFFNSGFLDGVGMDLAPPDLRGQIEAWNEIIYPNVNNGVYR